MNDGLILVLPTTDYSQKIPAIIGTHFIHNSVQYTCEQNGERFPENFVAKMRTR